MGPGYPNISGKTMKPIKGLVLHDGSGTVTVRASKTDQEGEGVTLYVGPSTVQRVKAWTDKAGIEGGALFRRIRRDGHVQTIVKVRAQAVGIDATYPVTRCE